MRKLSILFAIIVTAVAVGTYRYTIVYAQNSIPSYSDTIYATYTTNSLLKPTGVYITAASPNYLFIADTGHNQIDYFNNGSLQVLAGNGTAGYVDSSLSSSEFNAPTGIFGVGYYQRSGGFNTVPTVGIDLLVIDSLNNAVRHICSYSLGQGAPPTCNPVGVTTTAGGQAGYHNGTGANAAFNSPTSSNLSAAGTQLIADIGNNALRSTNSAGTTIQTISSSAPGFVNGPLSSAQFRGVTSLTSTTGTNPITLMSDTGNFVIRSLDSNNNVSTFAGSGIQGYADGPAASAKFGMPLGVTYNSADSYTYVADALNNCIRRIDSYGNVSTYAGQAGSPGLTDGSNSQAQFSNPTSVAIANGVMYVADTTNNAIRRIDMKNLQVSTYIH